MWLSAEGRRGTEDAGGGEIRTGEFEEPRVRISGRKTAIMCRSLLGVATGNKGVQPR